MKYINPKEHFDSRPIVHVSQRQPHVTPVSSPLYVVTVITNPLRYASRYRLYQAFEKMVEDAGAILYTVELATRDRHHEITSHDNPRHIQLRSHSVLWHKENLINIGISRLPHDWEYVAWVDADVQFARPDWAVETIHQLQLYKVVQMWSHAMDIGPNSEPIGPPQTSIFHSYVNDTSILDKVEKTTQSLKYYYAPPGQPYKLHPGYAWAARRSAISDLGGLGDSALLGAGDRHMAYALLGRVDLSLPEGLQPAYEDYWVRWQERAEQHIKRNVGFVPGMITHGWHGNKRDRRYHDRWKILVDNKYDPLLDIKYDTQGVLQLTDRNIKLRDGILEYFRDRNEDSIDL